jgi:hypothetical protein
VTLTDAVLSAGVASKFDNVSFTSCEMTLALTVTVKLTITGLLRSSRPVAVQLTVVAGTVTCFEPLQGPGLLHERFAAGPSNAWSFADSEMQVLPAKRGGRTGV